MSNIGDQLIAQAQQYSQIPTYVQDALTVSDSHNNYSEEAILIAPRIIYRSELGYIQEYFGAPFPRVEIHVADVPFTNLTISHQDEGYKRLKDSMYSQLNVISAHGGDFTVMQNISNTKHEIEKLTCALRKQFVMLEIYRSWVLRHSSGNLAHAMMSFTDANEIIKHQFANERPRT